MKNKIIASLFLVWILSSCTKVEIEQEQKINTFKQNIENAKTQFSQTETNTIVQANVEKKLSIDDRCIWCAKCIRIAPNNFAMDFDSRQAVVVSQENVDSDRVQASIDVCPVDSISLG